MKKPRPKGVTFVKWLTNDKDLPKKTGGIYAVECEIVRTGERWFSFGEFVVIRFPKCKVDFDEWRILGVVSGRCFARFSKENSFNVIAWTKMKADYAN